jgi:copper transport protein
MLAAALAFELGLGIVILGLVGLWRFTPPPRALAALAPISIHIHGEKAMAEIEIGQGQRAQLVVLDGEFRPLAVKQVVLVLGNPAAGIEPMRRAAAPAGENSWQIEGLRIPVAGRWKVQVEMLISDFEKLTIADASRSHACRDSVT